MKVRRLSGFVNRAERRRVVAIAIATAGSNSALHHRCSRQNARGIVQDQTGQRSRKALSAINGRNKIRRNQPAKSLVKLWTGLEKRVDFSLIFGRKRIIFGLIFPKLHAKNDSQQRPCGARVADKSIHHRNNRDHGERRVGVVKQGVRRTDEFLRRLLKYAHAAGLRVKKTCEQEGHSNRKNGCDQREKDRHFLSPFRFAFSRRRSVLARILAVSRSLAKIMRLRSLRYSKNALKISGDRHASIAKNTKARTAVGPRPLAAAHFNTGFSHSAFSQSKEQAPHIGRHPHGGNARSRIVYLRHLTRVNAGRSPDFVANRRTP